MMETGFQTDDAAGFRYRRNWLDFRLRRLVVENEGLTIDTGGLLLKKEAFLPADEIVGFRYGVQWIRGIYFYVALDFYFYFLLKDKTVVTLSYRSHYGFGKDKHHQFFSEVLDAIWNRIIVRQIKEALQQLNEGNEITIHQVRLSREGVTIRQSGFITDEWVFIPWQDVATADYASYFVIYSVKDKARINCSYRYLDDWNTALLNSVIRTVLQHLNEENDESAYA